jgi:acetyl-CoA carboxylase biotin carboxyl carrier protein
MEQLKYEDVMEILRLIDTCECQELNLAWGDFKLVLKKHNGENGESAVELLPHEAPANEDKVPFEVKGNGKRVEDIQIPQDDAPSTTEKTELAAMEVGSDQEVSGVEVKSPMVGTFYSAPAPGAAPFVEVGSIVTEKDTLCIIEVMKVMNTVKAPCKGRVAKICVNNEDMVSYGQTLMIIEPIDQ